MNQIIYDMPAETYHDADGVSNSDLKKFDKSAQHYIESKKKKNEPTASMLFGTAYHKAVFEWPEFEANKAIKPKFAGEGARTKQKQWEAENATKIVITESEHADILAMRAAILAHPMASKMIVQGRTEVSAFYQDEEFGLLRKCRADFLPDNSTAIVDLKTTTDASVDAFSKTIYDFGYFQQAAYYLDLFNALAPSNPRDGFCFIAQEKEPPYAVACYYLNEEAIALGRIKYRKLLSKFALCQQSNTWPGYGDNQLVSIGVPKWAKRKEETGVDVFYSLAS